MAALNEWIPPDEMGDVASMTAAGWVQVLTPINGTLAVDSTVHFADILGNGGAYSIKLRNGYGGGVLQWKSPPLPTPVATFRHKMHFMVDSLQASYIKRFYKGSNVVVAVGIDTSGHVIFYSGASPLQTSVKALAINTQYLIEIGCTIGNSGLYEVRVNGTSVGWIPSTVGDTQPGSDTTVDISALEIDDTVDYIDAWFDDVWADDTDWIGESVVGAFAPSGAGTTTELTPSSGANYTTVNETPPVDSSYNKATVANKKDTYASANLPGTAAHVNGVKVCARVVRAAGADIGTVYLVVRSGGTDYEDGGHHLDPSYTIVSEVLGNDPATSAPWTPSGVNAAEIGVRFDT